MRVSPQETKCRLECRPLMTSIEQAPTPMPTHETSIEQLRSPLPDAMRFRTIFKTNHVSNNNTHVECLCQAAASLTAEWRRRVQTLRKPQTTSSSMVVEPFHIYYINQSQRRWPLLAMHGRHHQLLRFYFFSPFIPPRASGLQGGPLPLEPRGFRGDPYMMNSTNLTTRQTRSQ